MTVSSVNETGPPPPPLESFLSVVTKNVIVTALCVSINYINATQIHTFTKHQVWEARLARSVRRLGSDWPALPPSGASPDGDSRLAEDLQAAFRLQRLILSSALCCSSAHCPAHVPSIVACVVIINVPERSRHFVAANILSFHTMLLTD